MRPNVRPAMAGPFTHSSSWSAFTPPSTSPWCCPCAEIPHRRSGRFRKVAGPAVLVRVDIGLAQNRSRTVRPLPVVRQLADRQPQRVARQMRHRDPRKQWIAGIAHHQMQILATVLWLPAKPLVAAREADRREVKQQAAQRTLVAVQQEVAQVLADWVAVAERVVAFDEFVPLGDRLGSARELQPQRVSAAKGPAMAGCGAERGPGRSGAWGPRAACCLGGRVRIESRSSSSSRRSAS